MVRLAGFEPATYGLEVRCSIQLSYRRTKDGKKNSTAAYHMLEFMSIQIHAKKAWVGATRIQR